MHKHIQMPPPLQQQQMLTMSSPPILPEPPSPDGMLLLCYADYALGSNVSFRVRSHEASESDDDG